MKAKGGSLDRPSPGGARLSSLVYWGVAVLLTVYTAGAVIVGPAINHDAANGFRVADSMAAGGAFNHLTEPDPSDIARSVSSFSVAFSPGQYAFSLILERAGLTLGLSISIVTALFTALGLVGWYRLYRLWGFPEASSAVAIGIVACTHALALPFGTYNGGEVLLFGVAPWFLALLWRSCRLSWLQACTLVVAFAALAFAKLSGLVLAYSALAAVVVYDLWPFSFRKLRRPVAAGVIAVAFGVPFYLFWLSGGWTAVAGTVRGSASVAWQALPLHFAEGLAATFTGMLSLGDIAERVFANLNYPVGKSLDLFFLIMSVPALGLAAYAIRRLASSHRDYLRFALALAAIYLALMALIYASGSEINRPWGAERYFRPLSLVLLIGVVQATAIADVRIRHSITALAAVAMACGVASYFTHLNFNMSSRLSERGFRDPNMTAAVAAEVGKNLDGACGPKGAIVYVALPQLALEFRQARAQFTNVARTSLEDLRAEKFRGRVGCLVVLLDQEMVDNGSADAVLNSFVDYDRARWTAVALDGFVVFSQRDPG